MRRQQLARGHLGFKATVQDAWHERWMTSRRREGNVRWLDLTRRKLEKSMDEPRRAPIHQSLTRPLLLAGAERELVLVNGTVISALVFGVGFHWVSLTIAALLATMGHWALTRAAKYEARLSQMYLRHVRYQAYYPARPLAGAPSPWIYPSVQD